MTLCVIGKVAGTTPAICKRRAKSNKQKKERVSPLLYLNGSADCGSAERAPSWLCLGWSTSLAPRSLRGK